MALGGVHRRRARGRTRGFAASARIAHQNSRRRRRGHARYAGRRQVVQVWPAEQVMTDGDGQGSRKNLRKGIACAARTDGRVAGPALYQLT